MNIDIETYKSLNKLNQKNNNLRRWTTFITKGSHDEISKQALNAIICYMLAVETESKGKKINWNLFPKIAIYRAFQKAYVNYDVPEHILEEICSLGKIDFNENFKGTTFKTIEDIAGIEFAEFLKQGCDTTEEKIYKASTKIATLLELKEIKNNVNGDYDVKYEEIISSMVKYEDIPGFEEFRDQNGNYWKVFKDLSKLRFQNRWAAYSYQVECSVLGHLFETAVYAYFMALEKGLSEEIATKCFFMGIFHDVPEAYTRDIPSPVKDTIPDFRELTEKYELIMMERHVYPFVSDKVRHALEKVMFETEENAEFKTLMKGADYMSAIAEIWRQLKAGTRDEEFVEAMKNHFPKFKAGIAEFTASTEKFAKEMLAYAESLNL
ncbi:MAG: YfbR-like 5'-deoxynucleotidase [Clostridia bacterium]